MVHYWLILQQVFFDSGFVKIARHIINLECTIIGINLLLFVLILTNLSKITSDPWPQAVLLISHQIFVSKNVRQRKFGHRASVSTSRKKCKKCIGEASSQGAVGFWRAGAGRNMEGAEAQF